MAVIRFLHVRVPHTSFRQTAYRFDQLSINYKQIGFKKDSPWVPRCWRIIYFACDLDLGSHGLLLADRSIYIY